MLFLMIPRLLLMMMTPLCSPICCTLSCCHPFVALLPGNRAHRPSLQGSVFWMAPEVVKQTAYTKKADIWSVGCLVVEMLTGEHPWAQLTQMQAIFKVYISRLTKPLHFTDQITPPSTDWIICQTCHPRRYLP